MINVDAVYQTVQTLANKEQRGYLTPQEFNLIATQAQQDIFEQYLYDLDAVREAGPLKRELGDSLNHILFKIQNTAGVTIDEATATYVGGRGYLINPINFTGKIFCDDNGTPRTLTQIEDIDEIYDTIASRWHRQGFDNFVYFEDGYSYIRVFSGTGEMTGPNLITYEEIRGFPGLASWGYVVINEKPVYDPAASNNFALHESELPDLVSKILKLAGISMEDQELYQAGAREEAQNEQQQNK
jgi:hypothetical protein